MPIANGLHSGRRGLHSGVSNDRSRPLSGQNSDGHRREDYYGKQGKGFDRFYLAVPARGGQSAEVRIYTVQD